MFWPAGRGPARPVLVTATSASAAGALPGFTVAVVVAVLFVVIESTVALVMIAVAVMTVPVGTSLRTCILKRWVALAPIASDGILQPTLLRPGPRKESM